MTVGLISPSPALLNASADNSGLSPRRTLALVNNMPDGAFEATERQFVGLLNEGSGTIDIEVRRYTMEGVPRGEATSSRINQEYFALADLYGTSPDLLIVTGSNPIEVQLEDELYWSDLVELLSWSRENVTSTLLSCLSAHAALRVFDGVARTGLPAKCSGVFSQYVEADQTLSADLEPELLLPHSRWNTVPREALERAGYAVVIYSAVTDWSVATRDENGRQLVLVQGHPEYDPSSLLREYRRDAERYVRRERDDGPHLPLHCVSLDDWAGLEHLHHEVVLGQRDPVLFEQYPFEEVGARAPWPWRPMAKQLFANWLTSVSQGEE